MPRLSCWIVRVALGYLLVGTALGAVLLAGKAFPPIRAFTTLRPLHAELLTIGWMMQFVLGIAYWILPRHATVAPRGAATPVVVAFVLLNAGVWLVGLGMAFAAPAAVPLAGRLAELAAAAAFAVHAWRRVKPFGAGSR